jgi:cobalt-zinc-cadmium efflux system membrane fusion protein
MTMTIEKDHGPKQSRKHPVELLALCVWLVVCSPLRASEGDHHDENTRVVTLSSAALGNATLTTAVAGAGDVDQQLTLYGKLLPEPTAVSHIRARYPGVVSGVKVHIGDKVKR